MGVHGRSLAAQHIGALPGATPAWSFASLSPTGDQHALQRALYVFDKHPKKHHGRTLPAMMAV
jgi:hypothetical protein